MQKTSINLIDQLYKTIQLNKSQIKKEYTSLNQFYNEAISQLLIKIADPNNPIENILTSQVKKISDQQINQIHILKKILLKLEHEEEKTSEIRHQTLTNTALNQKIKNNLSEIVNQALQSKFEEIDNHWFKDLEDLETTISNLEKNLKIEFVKTNQKTINLNYDLTNKVDQKLLGVINSLNNIVNTLTPLLQSNKVIIK